MAFSGSTHKLAAQATKSIRQDQDRILLLASASSSTRTQCSSGLAWAIALFDGIGFSISVDPCERPQTSEPPKCLGEEHPSSVVKARIFRETNRLAQLPAFARDEFTITWCRHQGRSRINAAFQLPYNPWRLHLRGWSAKARSEPKSHGFDVAHGIAKSSAPSAPMPSIEAANWCFANNRFWRGYLAGLIGIEPMNSSMPSAQYLWTGRAGKNGPIGTICGQNSDKISNQVANGLVVWIQPTNSLLVRVSHKGDSTSATSVPRVCSHRVSGPNSRLVRARPSDLPTGGVCWCGKRGDTTDTVFG